ncbi:2562_t:CDS:1 [Scutellospora calospora]|uniref:2562_t:CDS:1 n=1 Tax=Scutellospora calospora TaxID=85575 RepID=A0ACA9LEI0_9GLOM|nr:2562_t:CDS:1 [Scutellospora calospora]
MDFVSTNTVDSYVQIELIEPNLTISNGRNSKVCNNTNQIEISDFVSVNTTVFQGTSANSYVQIEQLSSLINEKKNKIDEMLGSQPVYAIGPYFQQGYSVLSIACWVTKPLNKILIEKLSDLFNDMYEIIEIRDEDIDISNINENKFSDENQNSGQESIEGNETNGNGGYGKSEEENTNDGNGNGGENSNNRNGNSSENANNGNDGNKNNNENANNGNKNGGNGGGDGNNNGKSSVEDDQFIQILSAARAKEDENFQSFEINAHLRANINNMIDDENILNFSIELIACGADEMLNKKCQSLQGWFVGFYLESIIIEVSPISLNINNNSSSTNNNTNSEINNNVNNTLVSFILKDKYRPQQIGPEKYEVSTDNMTNNSVQCSLSSQSLSATVSRNLTHSDSTKATICEWEMKMKSCPIKGVIWPYHFKNIKFDKIDDHRICPDQLHHSGKWGLTESMQGFRITIKQILGCNIKSKSLSRKKVVGTFPQIMRTCPQITHQLDISFNNITNFNENFAKLTKLKPDRRIIDINFENDSIPQKTKEGIIHITRNISQKSTQGQSTKNKILSIFKLNTIQ